MRKIISLLLAMLMLFALCACNNAPPEPTPTPTPEPTPTPTPEPTELDKWVMRAQDRYNMKYADFAEYWSMMCDGFYGDSVKTILSVISFEDKDKEIEDKRAEYDEKYSDGWIYEVTGRKETALDKKACSDFAEELKDISERAAIVVTASEGWGKTEWKNFADAHDCTVDEAEAVVKAYKAISEACTDAKVTDAKELTLTMKFAGSNRSYELSEDNCVYKVNGVYVSEMLLDYSYALLNLVA